MTSDEGLIINIMASIRITKCCYFDNNDYDNISMHFFLIKKMNAANNSANEKDWPMKQSCSL